MIVGSITEMTDSGSGAPERYHNGAAIVIFYTMADAEVWALLQSSNTTYGSPNQYLRCLCTIINTETSTKRWWFNGTEYTG
jgi:hypothetical protein